MSTDGSFIDSTPSSHEGGDAVGTSTDHTGTDNESEFSGPEGKRFPQASRRLSATRINIWLARRIGQDDFPLSILPDWWSTNKADVPPDFFIARTATRATSTFLASAITIFVVFFTFFGEPPVFAAAVGGSVGFLAAGLIIFLRFGNTLAARRRHSQEIESLLPDAIGFMYSQAEGQTNIYSVIGAMADADDAYGAVAEEFRAVTRRCEYFGEDLRQALVYQAQVTPSDDLSRLFNDMITFIESGSDISEFFEREASRSFDKVENEQQEALDFIDLLSTMYIPFSVVPVLLVLIVAGISSFQSIGILPIVLFGYVFAPVVPIVFMLLTNIVQPYGDQPAKLTMEQPDRDIIAPSIINSAEGDTAEDQHISPAARTRTGSFGGGTTIDKENETAPTEATHPATGGLVDQETVEIAENVSALDGLPLQERFYRIKTILQHPIAYFTTRPNMAAVVSIPLALVLLVSYLFIDQVPLLTFEALLAEPIYVTTAWVYVPLVVAVTPVSLFHELGRRSQAAVRSEFPEALQKISSVNETGMTLIKSLKQAATEQDTQINKELRIIQQKVELGIPAEQALVEFANTHRDPQISRTTRLLIEAQRASERVSDVLDVAIRAALTRENLREKHASETKSYLAMISVTTIVIIIATAILNRTLLPLIGGEGLAAIQTAGAIDVSGGNTIDPDQVQTILFHMSFQYAALGGMFSGFISTGEFKSGLKYALGGMLVSILTWYFLTGGVAG
jgi:flagellar protein FlaJ